MHGRGACSFAWQAPAALILGVWLFVVPDGGHGLVFSVQSHSAGNVRSAESSLPPAVRPTCCKELCQGRI